MDEVACAIAVVSIIMSVIGPITGVVIAAIFARFESKRQGVFGLFVKISEDSQKFRTACIQNFLAKLAASANDPIAAMERREALDHSVTALNGDKLLLGLLFGKSGDSLGIKINRLIAMADVFNRAEPPDFNAFQEEVNKRVRELGPEIERLHRAFLGVSWFLRL